MIFASLPSFLGPSCFCTIYLGVIMRLARTAHDNDVYPENANIDMTVADGFCWTGSYCKDRNF